MKNELIFVIYLISLISCNQKYYSRNNNDNSRLQMRNSCNESQAYDVYFGKDCIKDTSILSCVKIIENVKKNGLESLVYGKTWTQPIHREREYKVNEIGIVSVTDYWPDGRKENYKPKSKFYRKNGRLYYFQPEDGSSDKVELNFEIKFVGCVIDDTNHKTGIFTSLIISDGVEKDVEKERRPIQIYNQKNYLQLDSPFILEEPEVWHTVSTDI